MECTQVLPGSERSCLELNETREKSVVGTLTIDDTVHEIYNCENIIGRSDACTIVIKNDAISTKHAVIEANDFEDHVIYDLGSTNRTKLGKTILKPHVRYFITDGSAVSFADVLGQYKYVYKTDSPDSKASKSFCIPETPEKSEAPMVSPEDSIMRDLDIIESSDIDMFDEPFEEELNTSNNEVKSEEVVTKEDIYSMQTQTVLFMENDNPNQCEKDVQQTNESLEMKTLVKTKLDSKNDKSESLDQSCTSIYDMPTQTVNEDEEIFEGTMEEEDFERSCLLDVGNKKNTLENEDVKIQNERDLREEDTIDPSNYNVSDLYKNNDSVTNDHKKKSDVIMNEHVKIQNESDLREEDTIDPSNYNVLDLVSSDLNKESSVTVEEEKEGNLSRQNKTFNSDRLFTTLEVDSIVTAVDKNASTSCTNDASILQKSIEVKQLDSAPHENDNENQNSFSNRRQITDICTQDLLCGSRDSDSDDDFFLNKTSFSENSINSSTKSEVHCVEESIIKLESAADKLNILENKNDEKLDDETNHLTDEKYSNNQPENQQQSGSLVEVEAIEQNNQPLIDKNHSSHFKNELPSVNDTIETHSNADNQDKSILEAVLNQSVNSNYLKDRFSPNAEEEDTEKNIDYQKKKIKLSQMMKLKNDSNNEISSNTPEENTSGKNEKNIENQCFSDLLSNLTLNKLTSQMKNRENMQEDHTIKTLSSENSENRDKIATEDNVMEIESKNLIDDVKSKDNYESKAEPKECINDADTSTFTEHNDTNEDSLATEPLTEIIFSEPHKQDLDIPKICNLYANSSNTSKSLNEDNAQVTNINDAILTKKVKEAETTSHSKIDRDFEENMESSNECIITSSHGDQETACLSEMLTQPVASANSNRTANDDEGKLNIKAGTSKAQDDIDVSLSEMPTQPVPSSYKSSANNVELRLDSSKIHIKASSSKDQDNLNDVSLSEMMTQPVAHKSFTNNDEGRLDSSKLHIKAGSSNDQDNLNDVSLSEMMTQPVPSYKSSPNNVEERLDSSKIHIKAGSSNDQDNLNDVSLSEMLTQPVPSHKSSANNVEERLDSTKIHIKASTSNDQDNLNDVSLSEMMTQPVAPTYKSSVNNVEDRLDSSKIHIMAGTSKDQNNLNDVSLSEMMTQPVAPSYKSSANNVDERLDSSKIHIMAGTSKDLDNLNDVSLSEMMTQPVSPSYKSSANNVDERLDSSKIHIMPGTSKDQDNLNDVSLSEMMTQPVVSSYSDRTADNAEEKSDSSKVVVESDISGDQADLDVSLSEMLTQPVSPSCYKKSPASVEEKLNFSRKSNSSVSSKDQVKDKLNDNSLSEKLTEPVVPSCPSVNTSDDVNVKNLRQSEVITEPESSVKISSSSFDKKIFKNLSLCNLSTRSRKASIQLEKNVEKSADVLSSSSGNKIDSSLKDDVDISEMQTQPVLLKHEGTTPKDEHNKMEIINESNKTVEKKPDKRISLLKKSRSKQKSLEASNSSLDAKESNIKELEVKENLSDISEKLIQPIATKNICTKNDGRSFVNTSNDSVNAGSSTKIEILKHAKNITVRQKKFGRKKLLQNSAESILESKAMNSSQFVHDAGETLNEKSAMALEVDDSKCSDIIKKNVADNPEILGLDRRSNASSSKSNDLSKNNSLSPIMGRGKRKRIKKVYEDFCTEENLKISSPIVNSLTVESNSSCEKIDLEMETDKSQKETPVGSRKRKLRSVNKASSSGKLEDKYYESKDLQSSDTTLEDNEHTETVNLKRKRLASNEEKPNEIKDSCNELNTSFETSNPSKSPWNSPLNTTAIKTYSKKKSLVTINENKLPFIPLAESPSKKKPQKLNITLPQQKSPEKPVQNRSKSLNIHTTVPIIDLAPRVLQTKEVQKPTKSTSKQKSKENNSKNNNEDCENNSIVTIKKTKLSASRSTKKNNSCDINQAEQQSSVDDDLDETNQKLASKKRSNVLKSDRISRASTKSMDQNKSSIQSENEERNSEENSEILRKYSLKSNTLSTKNNNETIGKLKEETVENVSNENCSLKKSFKLRNLNRLSTNLADSKRVEECDVANIKQNVKGKKTFKKKGAKGTDCSLNYSDETLNKTKEIKNKFAELGNIDPVVKLKKYLPSTQDIDSRLNNTNETSSSKLRKRSNNLETSPKKNNTSEQNLSKRNMLENSKEVGKKRKLMSQSEGASEGEEDSFVSLDSENSPARRSSRKRKVNTRLQAWYGPSENVMFTGYSDPKAVTIINKLGGKIVESAQSCTVLVTDKVRRTVKFLCALALGRPIVSPSWITSCKASNSFLDYDKYLLNDKEAEKQFSFKLKESLNKASNKQLLEGVSIFVTNSVKPPPSEMKNIIECSGGIFLQTKPNNWPNNSFIISCLEDKSKWNTLKKKNAELAIVSAEVILTGILQQTLDIEKYRL